MTARNAFALTLLLCLFSALLPASLEASGGPRYRVGHVAAKGLILSEEGNPYWVEYDVEGNVIHVIGEVKDQLVNSWLMPGNDYRLHMAGFAEIEAKNSSHRQILLRKEYEAHTFYDAAGKVLAKKPELLPSTRSVVVRSSDVLYSDRDLILLQSPLNLQQAKPIAGDISALLISDEGIVVYAAKVNIGYRVAFYTPNEYDPTAADKVDMMSDGNYSLWGYKNYEDKLWGPIEGAMVESTLGRRGAYTGADGRYAVTYYIPPCPGFSWFYDSMVMVSLKYQNFNPNGKKLYTYYSTMPDYDACSGFGDFGAAGFSLGGLMAQMFGMSVDMGIESNVMMRKIEFPIDLAMLSGEADVRNLTGGALPQGQETSYGYEAIDFQPIVPEVDLDGNGQKEVVKLDPQTHQLSFWFAGSDPEKDPPILTRQADFSPDFSHQGLVKRISHADLRNTDAFIYRVSNGQLFSARNGLLGSEADEPYFGDVSTTTDTTIHYRQIIRGPRMANAKDAPLEKWQARTNVNPELRGWQADHIRTGEQLKIVMVNRATGYIGSGIATYGENTQKGGVISFTPPKINMRPPNLKIKVERKSIVEAGLTAGEEKVYTIGFEGSGLTSDEVITITTDWFDQDGSPLPEDLPGYTGRLAKVVDVNTLGQASNQIANFPIQPGHNMVVVKLPQKELDNAHFYVHVNGEAMEGQPDFSSAADFKTTGAGEGALQYRPKHYVPIQTAVYDEALTKEAKEIRQKAINKAIAEGKDPNFPPVEPVYQWAYRPEMQFSLFDLQKVQYIDPKEEEDKNKHDLIGGDIKYQIDTSESYIFLYELLADDLPMLDKFGPDRELVFRFGQQEILVVPGKELRELNFGSIDLSILDPAELMALSLYQNGDDANVLWEYTINPLVDLDVDSDNNNGLNPPDRTDIEEKEEYLPATNPADKNPIGKIIGVHSGDADGDNIPDMFDFNYHEDNGTETLPDFVPIVVELPASIALKAKARFLYSASDPYKVEITEDQTSKEISYKLPPGNLRIWKKDSTENRIVSADGKSGDFLNSYTAGNKAEYKFTDLVKPDDLKQKKYIATLYVEAVRGTTTPEQQKILLQVDPDGPGKIGFVSSDEVIVTAVQMDMVVGVNEKQEVAFEDDGSHRTSKTKPFRFWLNNDFDVVSDSGEFDLQRTTCDDRPIANKDEATCEQWDDEPAWAASGPHPAQYIPPQDYPIRSNIYAGGGQDSNLTIIESERDLEDFSPLAMKAVGLHRKENGEFELPEGWKLKLRTKNVGLNLFRGVWETGLEYLHVEEEAKKQVNKESKLYLFAMQGDEGAELPFRDNKSDKPTFGQDDIAKFIFEGIQASPIYVPQSENDSEAKPKETYLEAYLTDGTNEISIGKTYINIQDVKEYYDHVTVGKGYYNIAPVESKISVQPIRNTFDLDEKSYVLMVHGWRMLYWERLSFAETSFKRLYWSGYKGRFGAFTWPTGWFKKPAHIYSYIDLLLNYLPGYEQNYDNSEVIARKSGKPLADYLNSLSQKYSVHVMAHSMGNVVVSEALKIAMPYENSASPVVSYAALMAASDVGSYRNSADDNYYSFNNDKESMWNSKYIPDGMCSGSLYVEEAWRCANITSDSWWDRDYDMPPDKYRFNVPSRHRGFHKYREYLYPAGFTKEALEKPYYFRNNEWSKNMKIYNYFNEEDAALNAWELNQITKPESGITVFGPTTPEEPRLEHNYQWKIVEGCDFPCLADLDNLAVVEDLFTYHPVNNGPAVPLIWQEPVPGSPAPDATIQILSHILPARTPALGQVRGDQLPASFKEEPWDLRDKLGLTKSNQDHSAVFHSAFYKRMDFWDDITNNYKEN